MLPGIGNSGLEDRVRSLNQKPVNLQGTYVLYWAQMNRRVRGNHALAFAVEMANSHSLPLLVYEGLTCSYPNANDRLHTFLLEGVPDNAKEVTALGAGYVFHLRKRKSDPNDAFYRVAKDAAAVVTDDYPVFVAARHNASAAGKVDCPYLAVDASCVVPMQRLEKREYAAYTIRPKINRLLPQYLKPLKIPKLKRKWEKKQPFSRLHTVVKKNAIPSLVSKCEISHAIPPSLTFRGGSEVGQIRLQHFLKKAFARYDSERNEPAAHATSNLSPYLHFGHMGALDVALAARDYAEKHGLIADAFLEELIVRRELAFNFASHVENPESFDNLPDWAKATLRKHAKDQRSPVYTPKEFEQAETYDDLWNACQKEMLLRGKIHGYYRMYWGKKIIEWSRTCEDALETMIDIHDRYALDGRDPNTYTNILWCFGLHDRPWTERPIFGQVRWMSLEGMKRKTDVDAYIQEIASLERTGKEPFPIS